MLDKFMAQMMESGSVAYMSKLEVMTRASKEELEEMKAKVSEH